MQIGLFKLQARLQARRAIYDIQIQLLQAPFMQTHTIGPPPPLTSVILVIVARVVVYRVMAKARKKKLLSLSTTNTLPKLRALGVARSHATLRSR
jgi:hypothetical protein